MLLLFFFDLFTGFPPWILSLSVLCGTGGAAGQEEGDHQELPAPHASGHRQRQQLHLRGQQPGSAHGQTSHRGPQRPPYVWLFLCEDVKVQVKYFYLAAPALLVVFKEL